MAIAQNVDGTYEDDSDCKKNEREQTFIYFFIWIKNLSVKSPCVERNFSGNWYLSLKDCLGSCHLFYRKVFHLKRGQCKFVCAPSIIYAIILFIHIYIWACC